MHVSIRRVEFLNEVNSFECVWYSLDMARLSTGKTESLGDDVQPTHNYECN